MNWKIRIGITLVVAGALASGTMVILKKRSQPAVTVTLRIAVTPGEQVEFKYLVGKQSGVKPSLAQKLSFKPVPRSSLVEARIGVLTKDEGRRYVEAFVPTLQELCGKQVQLVLAEQSIR